MKRVFVTQRNAILWLFLCNTIILSCLSFLPKSSHLEFFQSSSAIDTHTPVPVQSFVSIPLIFPEPPYTSLLPTPHHMPCLCSWMPYSLGIFLLLSLFLDSPFLHAWASFTLLPLVHMSGPYSFSALSLHGHLPSTRASSCSLGLAFS